MSFDDIKLSMKTHGLAMAVFSLLGPSKYGLSVTPSVADTKLIVVGRRSSWPLYR